MIAPVSVARSMIARGTHIVLRVPERVGENEPPFGVRIDDLDRLP